jgi:hypothetical protein
MWLLELASRRYVAVLCIVCMAVICLQCAVHLACPCLSGGGVSDANASTTSTTSSVDGDARIAADGTESTTSASTSSSANAADEIASAESILDLTTSLMNVLLVRAMRAHNDGWRVVEASLEAGVSRLAVLLCIGVSYLACARKHITVRFFMSDQPRLRAAAVVRQVRTPPYR